MNKKELAKMRRDKARELKRTRRQMMAGTRHISEVSKSFAVMQRQFLLSAVLGMLDKPVQLDNDIRCPLLVLL